MLLSVTFLILGFVLLIWGAGKLVSGASALAKRFGVSDLIVGLTIVAFGTSLPELTVNTFNASKGLNDALFGNVIGSNIFNIALILGILGLIHPIKVPQKSVAYEIPFSMALCVLVLFLVNDHFWGISENRLNRLDALTLLVGFVIFSIYIIKTPKISSDEETTTTSKYAGLWIIVGLIALIGGGYLTTTGAESVARALGMSEKLIALTVLSIGTSLPELVTSLVAAIRKNSDIAIGNVVGSNIFNITFILAISGFISQPAYDVALNFDLLVMLLSSAVLFMAMFTGSKRRLDRWEAVILLAIYVTYTIYIISRN